MIHRRAVRCCTGPYPSEWTPAEMRNILIFCCQNNNDYIRVSTCTLLPYSNFVHISAWCWKHLLMGPSVSEMAFWNTGKWISSIRFRHPFPPLNVREVFCFFLHFAYFTRPQYFDRCRDCQKFFKGHLYQLGKNGVTALRGIYYGMSLTYKCYICLKRVL